MFKRPAWGKLTFHFCYCWITVDEEIVRLKDVIAEITQENLPIKKDWELPEKDMRYFISEILETVNTTVLDRIPDQEDPCNTGNSTKFILLMA